MFCFLRRRRISLLQKQQTLENVQGFEVTNHGLSLQGKDLELFYELFEGKMCEALNKWCVTRRNYLWELVNFKGY